MKQIKFPKNSFIAGGYIDKKLCDEIIQFHKDFRHRCGNGVVGAYKTVHKDVKDSTDININFNEKLFREYNKELTKVAKIYMDKYKEVNDLDFFTNSVANTNVQYYTPNQGFKKWHCERNGMPSTRRILVFMTYLNDVPNGGTEFLYQGIKTKAEKGLTIIWPSDWTHTHKGIISKTHEKYIVTGWFSFL